MTTAAVRDYQLLLPAGWLRIPLDDRAAERVVLLATTQTRDLPAAQRDGVRHALVEMLTASLREAAGVGGMDALVCTSTLAGVPISASCVVARHEAPVESAAGLAEQLAQLDGEVTVVQLAGGPAVRRVNTLDIPYDAALRRQLEADLNRPSSDYEPTAHEVTYFVPLPGRSDFLVFTFSTPQPALAAALESLFDAIMGTLRWIR